MSLQQRLEIHRRILALRREILFRVATLPDAPSNETSGLILASYLDSLGEKAKATEIAVAVPGAFFPRHWESRGRRWKQPNGLFLLRDWKAIGSEKAELKIYLTLSGRGLGGLSEPTGLLRYLDQLEEHEPGLIHGVQIGDALSERPLDESYTGTEIRAVAGWLKAIFRVCAKRQWKVRIDAFAFANRGILHDALAEAVRSYEGERVRVCLGHIAALDETWIGTREEPSRGICFSNSSIAFEFESYPAFTVFTGRSAAEVRRIESQLVNAGTLARGSLGGLGNSVYSKVPGGCAEIMASNGGAHLND